MTEPTLEAFSKRVEEIALESMEESYRRGYHQGYLAAANNVQTMKNTGTTRLQEAANVLMAHAEQELLPWRNAPGNLEHCVPPRLDVPNWWALRHRVFARDGRRCRGCNSSADLEIDHIRPVWNGGLPELENLRVLCRTCNRGRARK